MLNLQMLLDSVKFSFTANAFEPL
ncbi:hypothetical protein CGLO_13761 [Colletotrichum gloeosporioides Cg-14]|uniref:Uncharacterized protein n=1 Tax=Colletotrichum gloeosporioides (strain Cg-14) TaxID=1237896 RepID=T0L6F3_COLGC|nr:hypothetical protein CGLO_13761 [Colletotrichum gloeosporioides Cg-14]